MPSSARQPLLDFLRGGTTSANPSTPTAPLILPPGSVIWHGTSSVEADWLEARGFVDPTRGTSGSTWFSALSEVAGSFAQNKREPALIEVDVSGLRAVYVSAELAWEDPAAWEAATLAAEAAGADLLIHEGSPREYVELLPGRTIEPRRVRRANRRSS